MASHPVLRIPLGIVSAYVLLGRSPVLVDAGPSGNARRILSRLQAAGINPSDLGLILLTHGHTDHFGSAAAVRELTGARIAIHPADAPSLRAGNDGAMVPTGTLGRVAHRMIGRVTVPAMEPDLMLEDGQTLAEFGIDGRVIATPGHTDGSVSVILSSGDVLVGDLVSGLIPPNRPTLPIFASDIGAVTESLRKVLAQNPKLVHTSHGGPFSPTRVQRLLH